MAELVKNNDVLLNLVTDHIISTLEKKDFKKKLIKKINDDIDIPMIGEKTEKKVFDKLYDLLLKGMKEVLNDED
jgi:hypothetical protein